MSSGSPVRPDGPLPSAVGPNERVDQSDRRTDDRNAGADAQGDLLGRVGEREQVRDRVGRPDGERLDAERRQEERPPDPEEDQQPGGTSTGTCVLVTDSIPSDRTVDSLDQETFTVESIEASVRRDITRNEGHPRTSRHPHIGTLNTILPVRSVPWKLSYGLL